MRSKANISQLNLPHGIKNKNRKIRKRNEKQKQICSEETVQSKKKWSGHILIFEKNYCIYHTKNEKCILQ